MKCMKILLMALLLSLPMISMAVTKPPAEQSIQFATEASYPPFEYVDQTGQIKGFDIDIAKALCIQMDAHCSFTNQPWTSLIPSLQMGKFDALIGAMAITKQRQQQVDFTKPYYFDTVSFVAPVASHFIPDAKSIKGKTIGVQGGTVLEQYLHATFGNDIKVKTYASQEQAFLDLASGRVDAVLGDTPLMGNWLKKQKPATYAFAGQPIGDPRFFNQGFGIAVKKGNTKLLKQLNDALAAIRANGTYNQIYKQYFGKMPK